MKKLLVAVFFCLLLVGSKSNVNFSLTNYVQGEYFAYLTSPTSESVETNSNYYVSNVMPKNYKILAGEMIIVENCNVKNLLNKLNAKVVNFKVESDYTIVYAYSNLISKTYKENGITFNLQIAKNKNKTFVGWPSLKKF